MSPGRHCLIRMISLNYGGKQCSNNIQSNNHISPIVNHQNYSICFILTWIHPLFYILIILQCDYIYIYIYDYICILYVIYINISNILHMYITVYVYIYICMCVVLLLFYHCSCSRSQFFKKIQASLNEKRHLGEVTGAEVQKHHAAQAHPTNWGWHVLQLWYYKIWYIIYDI